MIDQDILDYYASLLIAQYRINPKAIATIKLLTNQATCDGLAQAEIDAFNLDTAIGSQLDIIGRIVGVPRNVQGLVIGRDHYEFTTYASPASNGFASYVDTVYPSDIYWLTYESVASATYAMTDTEMRTLIKLKIELNTKNSSTQDITEILWGFFGDLVEFVDNKDMTTTVNISTDIQQVMEIAVFLGYIPKPMGVSQTINYV